MKAKKKPVVTYNVLRYYPKHYYFEWWMVKVDEDSVATVGTSLTIASGDERGLVALFDALNPTLLDYPLYDRESTEAYFSLLGLLPVPTSLS